MARNAQAGLNERKTRAELRKFGLTLGTAFLVFAGLSWWRGHARVPIVLAAIGATLLVAAVLVPAWLNRVERFWMGLAHALSKVTTPIFMGIIYFLVITPIGMLLKVLGRDPLTVKTEEDTLWVRHSSQSTGKTTDMRRQF